MNDLVIMYHYVGERPDWKGIVPISVSDFEKQIDKIAMHYDIVSPEDFNRKSSKARCVLSFDDATKDQYTNAFDVLKKKGLPAYFTVMSGYLTDKKVPVMHLVHTVLSLYSDKEIWASLNKQHTLIEVESKSLSCYHYETDVTRRCNKYVLNFLLDESQSRTFLEPYVIDHFGSMKCFIEEFYITKTEFSVMRDNGMTLGVHCVDHRPYCGDPWHFYKREIKPCEDFIKKELGLKPTWYTPAFGGGTEYKKMITELKPILLERGYQGGFTTLPGYNEGLQNFWLNRYDCFKLPSFKSSKLAAGCV